MDDAIDLSMSFEDGDDRPSSPHNTRETAIVIDDSDDDFDMAQKMPAASAASMPSWSSTTTAAAYNSAENSNRATVAAGSPSAQAVGASAARTSPINRTCASCGKEGNNLKKCSACKSVHYCNATCQYSHWSEHRDECHKNRTAVKREQQQQYATSTSARVSMSPTMNHAPSAMNDLHVPPAVAAAISAGISAAAAANRSKKYSCSLCPQKFMTQNQRRKHEKKCRKRHLKKAKTERGNGGRGGVGKVKAEKPKAKEKEEGEEDVEEADEITYTSYKPQKLTFGMNHPDPVVENSTLSAVEPPEVEYNLAMPADILSVGKLSNLQLEAIVYGCQRHLIDLPLKEGVVFDGGEVVVEKPARAGFLLGDGAGEC